MDNKRFQIFRIYFQNLNAAIVQWYNFIWLHQTFIVFSNNLFFFSTLTFKFPNSTNISFYLLHVPAWIDIRPTIFQPPPPKKKKITVMQICCWSGATERYAEIFIIGCRGFKFVRDIILKTWKECQYVWKMIGLYIMQKNCKIVESLKIFNQTLIEFFALWMDDNTYKNSEKMVGLKCNQLVFAKYHGNRF